MVVETGELTVFTVILAIGAYSNYCYGVYRGRLPSLLW